MIATVELETITARYRSSMIFGHREIRSTSVFEELPQDELLQKLRQYLTCTINASISDPQLGIVKNIDGIKLLETAKERELKRKGLEVCVDYVFSNENILVGQRGWIDRMILKENPIAKTAGALALYFDDDGNFCHIGRVTEDGDIESKWYLGHVYKHRPELVPDLYGTRIIYFADPVKNK